MMRTGKFRLAAVSFPARDLLRSFFPVSQQRLGKDHDSAAGGRTEGESELVSGVGDPDLSTAASIVQRQAADLLSVVEQLQLDFSLGRKRGMQSDPDGKFPESLRRDPIPQRTFAVRAEGKPVSGTSGIQFQREYGAVGSGRGIADE